MQSMFIKASVTCAVWRIIAVDKLRDERGEGVVSVAIAVLIMAALGVAAFGAFNALFDNTVDQAENQIGQIGN